MEELRTIDLIIPVYKPDNKFKQLMERLLEQTILPNHIFILHTLEEANSDSYQKLLDEFIIKSSEECRIIIIDILKAEFDHGGTRNYGASLSNADIIMFMTQDAVPCDKELIRNMMEAFDDEAIGATYGRQIAVPKANILERYTRTFNYPPNSYVKSKKDLDKYGIKTYFCSNVCAAYRKDVYDELGGFVTKTIFNEDMIMAYYMIEHNYSIYYQALAKVYHSHEYTNIEQLKRNFDLAVSQQQYSHIFTNVKSEKEGIKYLKSTIKYLMNRNKHIYIPEFLVQTCFKYMGYLLGKYYTLLPKDIIKKISMNPSYWD